MLCNVTDYFYLNCIIVVYVEPLLCSVGFVLNCSCIAIFLSVSRRAYFRKTSLLTYLAALSACNALQLLLSVFVIILPAIEQFISEQYPVQAVKLRQLNSKTVRLGYPLLLSANYAAIWLLTLICAQRFQSICNPANIWKIRLQCVRRSKGAVTFIVIIAILLNVIRFWELKWDEQQLAIVSTELRDHWLYKLIQEGFLYGVVVYALPIACLFWLNLHTICLLRTEQLHVQPSRRSAEFRTALMTVCVFLAFLVCATLSASIRLFMIVAGNLINPLDMYWLVDLSNLLMNINALVQPLISFSFTRGFRDLFFVIRFAPPKMSFDDTFQNNGLKPMLSSYEYR